MAPRTSTIESPSRKRPRRSATKVPKVTQERFNAEELEEFRLALLTKRRELMGDTERLNTGASRHGSPEGGDRASTMPVHMAELGSDTWEHEFTFLLIENKQSLLREIDDALQRIENGTYGLCEATKRPIAKPRLRAIPWARHCIQYALRYEAGLA